MSLLQKTKAVKSKRTVSRKCTGCGLIVEKEKLLRIVRTKEGELSIDPEGYAEGRGAYICIDRECIEKAFKKNGLERSFRAGIKPEIKKRIFEEIREFERQKSGCADRNGDQSRQD